MTVSIMSDELMEELQRLRDENEMLRGLLVTRISEEERFADYLEEKRRLDRDARDALDEKMVQYMHRRGQLLVDLEVRDDVL